MTPFIDGMLNVPQDAYRHFERHVNFKDRFGEPVNMSVFEGNLLRVPRTFKIANRDVMDQRVIGREIEPGTPPGPRNEAQLKLINRVYAGMVNPNLGGLIVAPTGFGKTWVGCKLVESYSRTPLIVTTKNDEVEIWRKAARDFLGLTAQVWAGDRMPDPDCDFVVALVQSVAKGTPRYPKQLYDQFGLVIFDECHRLGADVFQQACWYLPARWRWGLTATPERSDGRERVFHAHLGHIVAQADALPMVPKVYRIRSKFMLPEGGTPRPGKNNWVDRMMRMSDARNIQMLQLIAHCNANNRNLVVFSNVKEHLSHLAERSVDYGVHPDRIGYYIGGMSQDALEAAAVKNVIFATYQMGGQGTNFPWWDACLMATPMANCKQPIGRVLREYPGKKQPVIFDMLDPGKVWGNFAKKRLSIYQEYGAEVIDVDI